MTLKDYIYWLPKAIRIWLHTISKSAKDYKTVY